MLLTNRCVPSCAVILAYIILAATSRHKACFAVPGSRLSGLVESVLLFQQMVHLLGGQSCVSSVMHLPILVIMCK